MEDVFPLWLQRKFDLQDQLLNLMNGTSIPYRQIKIPCCASCNNIYLSRIENTVSSAFDSGHPEFVNLDKKVLFLWLAKIFYGLLYKEHFLPFDRRNPASNRIISREALIRYIFHHLFLTAVIRPVDFVLSGTAVPASIFTFNVQTTNDIMGRFDFRDDKPCMVMSLRIGEVGVLVSFDGGVTEIASRYHFDQYKNQQLHPIQFEELSAQFFYRNRLLKRTPGYMIVGADSGAAMIQTSMRSVSQSDFLPWDINHYSQFLSIFTRVPLDKIRQSEDRIRTWLHETNEREFFSMPLSEYPWRGLT